MFRPLFALVSMFLSFLTVSMPVCAQAKLKVLFLDGRGNENSRSEGRADNNFLEQSFPSMITWGDTGAVFDPYYLDNLKRMAYEANPHDNPNEFDPDRAEEVAQKALTVKLADSANRTLAGSDLKDEYRLAIKTVSDLKKLVNYSVQRSDTGYAVSKKKKGKKLLEFQVEPSTRTGLSPQLKVGQMGRFRYDTDAQGLIFELRGKW